MTRTFKMTGTLSKVIKNLCNVIKLWRMGKLSLKGKITIICNLKNCALSNNNNSSKYCD